MLAFYGFILNDAAPPAILRGPDFPKRAANWLSPGNHNHLRITRILRSLRLLGLNEHAQAFFGALQEVYKERPSCITATTFDYWKRAAK
jgi:hypothetical protein